MQYRVGQRVRLLHETGEGVIVRLIDQKHVEVDTGDDFSIDVHISEIVPVDGSEFNYLGGRDDREKLESKHAQTIQQLGVSLLDLSMIVIRKEDDTYGLHLFNPEPATILYTCFIRLRGKYQGMSSGKLASGSGEFLFSLPKSELNQIKSFYFQALSFISGKGHPHQPLTKELAWNKNQLSTRPKFLPSLEEEGWVFSLRESKQLQEVADIPETTLKQVQQADTVVPREEPEIDLHIEKLVKRPHELAPSDMLQAQLQHLEQALADAISKNYAGMILIHGIGVGRLKAEVHQRLKSSPHVKTFLQADPAKYGNGATRVIFK
ncbi:MAG: Smr/MutS family protein [Bacteroidota bacterium]